MKNITKRFITKDESYRGFKLKRGHVVLNMTLNNSEDIIFKTYNESTDERVSKPTFYRYDINIKKWERIHIKHISFPNNFLKDVYDEWIIYSKNVY